MTKANDKLDGQQRASLLNWIPGSDSMAETPASGDQITAQIGDQGEMIAIGKQITQIKNVYQHSPARAIDAATLAAAHDRLAALPLDTIPALATLPTSSRLPLTPNPLFVGRQAALQTLARTLKGGETVAIGPLTVAAATGGGGYGKTQLAVAFAHRYGQYFAGGVFWLNFATVEGVPAEIASCGGAGFLDLRPDYAALPLADQVKLVQAAWQDGQPRLLIFDNCEEPTLLKQWRPTTGACRILITSRRASWDKALHVQPLPLGVLARPESVALLQRFLADQPPAATAMLDAIAAELGDLPLALHLAGSFLERYQTVVTPAAYLAQLRRPDLLQHRSLSSGDLSPTNHEQHVARTFALSYDRLDVADPVDQLALKLLARAAYFAPGVPIPRSLLLASGKIAAEDGEAAFLAVDALHRLVELGLLESETDGALRLHRLLARFVQVASVDGEAQGDVERTAYSEAYKLNQVGYPLVLLAWQPHLRHITDQAYEQRTEHAAALCNELGYHLLSVGNHSSAKPYYENALVIRKQILGEQHPDTALSLNNLGFLLKSLGDFASAQPYLEQALMIRRQVLGDQHADTIQSLNSMGGLFHNLGDLATARYYREQALEICKKVFGEKHTLTAICLDNLGFILQDMGDFIGAQPYHEQALAIFKEVLGEQHHDTGLSLNNLGILLKEQGDFVAATPYLEQALTVFKQVLGEWHPDTALGYNNMGCLMDAQGDLVAAKIYYEQALVIWRAVWGEWHSSTALGLSNLGMLLKEQGYLVTAKPYLEQALVIRRKVLGEQHPDTARSIKNMGSLLDA